MKCIHCTAQAEIKFTDKDLCNRCFCKVVENPSEELSFIGFPFTCNEFCFQRFQTVPTKEENIDGWSLRFEANTGLTRMYDSYSYPVMGQTFWRIWKYSLDSVKIIR